MKKLKILFCTSPYHSFNLADHKVYVTEPLQFEVLASLTDREKFEVELIDLRLERHSTAFANKIKQYQPDIIGFSAWTMHVSAVKSLAKVAKAFNSNIKIIVGGHHTQIAPSDFALPEIDFVLMSEAYPSYQQLLEGIYAGTSDFSSISGIAFQRHGEFYSNGQGVVTRDYDLDSLPIPDRTIIEKYKKQYYHLWWKPIASIRTAMGCPSKCSFCNLWKVNKGKYLQWSSDYVVEYLKSIEQQYVIFVDDHMFGDTDRAYEIGEKILKANLGKQYCIYSRSDAIVKEPELVELWAKAGLKRVRMGLEGFSDSFLADLDKQNSIEKNDSAIKILKKNQVLTEGLFLIGLDFKENEFQQLGDYILSRKIEVPNITVQTPMPGTIDFQRNKDKILYFDSHFYDFQHAVQETALDIKQYCKLYSSLMLRVQRPPTEQLRTIGLKSFLTRMPYFWAYFYSLRNSYKHYPHHQNSKVMPQGAQAILPWNETKRIVNLESKRAMFL